MFAYINGRILPEDQAFVSINDRGWLYGDAVFETLRTYGGRAFKFQEHLDRLERSAGLSAIEIPLARAALINEIDRLLETESPTKDIMIRVVVSRGVGGAGIFPTEAPDPTLVFQLRPLPFYAPEVFTKGWSLIVAETRRNDPNAINPLIKSGNFLNNIMAKREAVEAGANEALMLNREGLVAESTVSNFFLVKNGNPVTPPISDGILPGITRETVIKLGQKIGLNVQEKSIDPEALFDCDEAFLTLTSAGIIPITKINKQSLGTEIGPVTLRLRQAYIEHVEDFVRGEE